MYDPATGRALIVQTASRATKRSMTGASSALQACGGQRGLRSRMRAAAAAAGAGVASKGMQHDASMLPTAPTGAATQPPAGAILAVQAKLSAMSACAEAPRALSVRWFSPRATVLYLTGATAAALASWMLYRWLSGRSATALGSRDAVRATVLLLTDSSDDAAAATTAVTTASADVRSVLDGIQNVAHGAARWLRTTLQRGVVAPYPPAVVPSASWRASELA
ncbi:MAG: hypothetical protein EOO41_04035 [Methanobacteriota archaeon]|nr:MAG: hypothetical protein EOO41_04035 [Euryarchaeota archaeon]